MKPSEERSIAAKTRSVSNGASKAARSMVVGRPRDERLGGVGGGALAIVGGDVGGGGLGGGVGVGVGWGVFGLGVVRL